MVAVSSLMDGQYGMHDVCLSVPAVVGAHGLVRTITPPLTKQEEEQLLHSADVLKKTIASLTF